MNKEEFFEKLDKRRQAMPKGIHSRNHELAKEICDHFKVKEMGIWIAVARRVGYDELKAKFEKAKGKNARYLLAMTSSKKRW